MTGYEILTITKDTPVKEIIDVLGQYTAIINIRYHRYEFDNCNGDYLILGVKQDEGHDDIVLYFTNNWMYLEIANFAIVIHSLIVNRVDYYDVGCNTSVIYFKILNDDGREIGAYGSKEFKSK